MLSPPPRDRPSLHARDGRGTYGARAGTCHHLQLRTAALGGDVTSSFSAVSAEKWLTTRTRNRPQGVKIVIILLYYMHIVLLE